MQKPWFMGQGPTNIEIKDCVIDGTSYSGKLTKQVTSPIPSTVFGIPLVDVGELVFSLKEYRLEAGIASYYSLPHVLHLLRDYTGRVEKKALEWEAKCRLKEEEIRNLQATNHLLRVGLDAMLAVKEVKP